MKKLITICLLLATTMILNAQKKSTVAANVAEILKSNENKHTFMPGWCKLAKPSKGSALSESAIHVCQVCNAKDKKEKDAKLVEDSRRAKVISDKYKADKIASENARLEKIRLEKEEAKRIKDKEALDAIARATMMKKYKEIAEKGRIKSNLKGEAIATDFNLEKVKPFSDRNRKIYGFKIDETEILTLPWEGFATYIDKLAGSNYFKVNVYSEDDKGREDYSHSYLVNYLGEKLEFDNVNKFDYYPEISENTIYLIKILGTPEKVDNPEKYCYNNSCSVISIYDSENSATAKLESLKVRYGGYAMCFGYLVAHINQYKVNLNGKLIEKSEGYMLCSDYQLADKFNIKLR